MAGQQKVWIWFGLLIILLAFEASADPKNFTKGDLTGLQGRLAFTLRPSENQSSTEISQDRVFLLDMPSGHLQELIIPPRSGFKASSFPTLSPDGSRLAFTSLYNRKRQILILDIKSGAIGLATNCRFNCDNASWHEASEDGTPEQLVFYAEDATGDTANVVAITPPPQGSPAISQSEFSILTRNKGRNTTPVRSPSGDSIVFSTNRFWPGWDICSVKLDSGAEDCFLSGVQSYCRPKFSPDGQRVLYSGGIGSKVAIYSYDLGTKEDTVLADLSGKDYDIAFANNESFFFTSQNGEDDFGIFAYRVKGQEPLEVIRSKHGSLRFLSYAQQTIPLVQK